MYNKLRILIGSPVQQQPEVLTYFLEGFKYLIVPQNVQLSFYFIDNNKDPVSKLLLKNFYDVFPNTIIDEDNEVMDYFKDEDTHYWNDSLTLKVANLKNKILQSARLEKYDYVFLIDSDTILHPETLNQLLKADKPIVSNIMWTCWKPNTMEMPQVWLQDTYNLYYKQYNENISEEESYKRTVEFIDKLRVPGLYEVGGLAACTLINRYALDLGVSFDKISNLSVWGEDRYFCIRAVALGLPLYVDTHLPVYHVYRQADFPAADKYLSDAKKYFKDRANEKNLV